MLKADDDRRSAGSFAKESGGHDGRARTGSDVRHGRAHSEAIPRILTLLAADPDAPVLRARLEEEIRCAGADILAEGGGWDDVRTEMRQLIQAIAAVFHAAEVEAHEVREAYPGTLETAVDEMFSTS